MRKQIGTVKMATDAVYQLGEGTGRVPAAPLLMQLGEGREEVLERPHAPGPGPGTAGSAVLGRRLGA